MSVLWTFSLGRVSIDMYHIFDLLLRIGFYPQTVSYRQDVPIIQNCNYKIRANTKTQS